MLELTDLHKAYHLGSRQVSALRGASLRIDEPGFFAVMGRSGSGKSTLLHLIAGLDRPDSGAVNVDGRDIATLSESQLTEFRRRRVGIVFQKFNLIPTMTAYDNAALPGVLDNRPKSWVESRVRELFDQLDLTRRADHRPDALSGGEQQRVAIARAMLFAPPLLLADEPTGNLDSASSEHLWQLLGDLAEQQQMTIVMVTHEPAAAAHCDKVFVLADGRTHGSFNVDGLDASGVATRYQQLGG